MPQAYYHHEPSTATTTTTTTVDVDDDNNNSFHPVATAMKELEPKAAAPTVSITTTKGNTNEKQGLTEVAGMGVLQNCSSFSSSSKAAETFEDLYDYECDNSSTSTGFDDHDDEPDKEDEEGIDMDRQFHLPRNSNHHRLHEQHHYSDDDDDEEQEEDENVGGARKETNPLDHAHHRASLDHSHGGGGLNPEERKEVQATTTGTTTSSVTNSSAADNGVDVNDMSSAPSSSHSECSGDMSSPDSDAEDVNGSDGIRQNRDDLSTSPTPPPLIPQQPQQEEQQQHNNNQADDSSFTQETANACSAANPPELNPKNPSRSHLSIPRSIHFLATTPSDRPGSGTASPLGRLQIHTVNRLEVENSFLLNQNNSLTRDIHHCRQTVQALKQILAQREDTIGRMKQEAHQAHLKIKFMESLLSGQQQHHLGQPQQHQQQQQLHLHQQQQLPQQQQHKGLKGDWKERHRQEDDDEEYDDDEEEEEEEGEDARKEGERGSSSLLDMFAQSEQPFDWLLKGWDEGEMPVAEGDSDIERRPAGDNDEDEEDQDEGEVARGIPRPVLSIFSGVHDDEQYNSDEYIDDDGEEDDEDEEEQDFGQGAARPRSGEFEHRMQGSGIYHHQRSSSGEASALALSMSLSNNSTCILSQCGSSINNNDSDDEDDDNELDDPCDASVMTALNGDIVSGCAYVPVNRPQSPASLSSPALSESSMSLESHSEGSNGSVTSLSCSSLTSNSTADEKDGLVLDSTQLQQQQQQQGPVEAVSDMMSAGDNGCEADQQGLQLPAVVPYSSFRDSGHFPTQVFTMDYEEQHLVVVDDVDSHDEHDSDDDDDDDNDDNGAQEPQSSFRPFSPTTTATLLIHNTDSDTSLPPSSPTTPSKKGGLATLAAVLFKTKDVSHHHAMPLCQPNGNGSHPCLGASPPMAAPLALISRVNIETSASSTTLMSASSPSPIAAKAVLGEGGSRARPLSVATTTGASCIANWEPSPFYRDLETDVIGGSAATDSNKSLPSKMEVVAGTSTETTSNQDHGTASVDTTEESQSGGDDVVNSEDLGSNTVTNPTAGSSWGPSSLFKAWLPSKRKGKARSAKSKDRSDLGSSEARDAVYPEGGEVTTAITTTTTMTGKGSDDVIPVKEQSVAWTMLKSQAPSAIVTSTATAEAAGEGGAERQQQQLSPMVSESASPTSTLFSRVFGGRSSRAKA